MARRLLFLAQLSCLFVVGDSVPLLLDSTNFDAALSQNQLVLVNFYAEWCRFSQILKPIFSEASEKWKDSPGKVLFGSVDCDKQPQIAQRFKVTKYPTIKLFRHGQLVKKEYRGQRSVDAFTEFIKHQIESTVHHINEQDDLNKVMETKKRNIIGYFNAPGGVEYDNFQKISSVLRDECAFWIGVGNWTRQKSIAGNSVFFRNPDNDSLQEFTGPIASYDDLLRWAHANCVSLIREITFENAEELTEEGIPFLILFRNVGDKQSEDEFAAVVKHELIDHKSSVNFLVADGKKFAHPLFHLGKKESDLPVIAIDSFRHMFIFPNYTDIRIPGKLRAFVEDLDSGKLHREYHHGPDRTTKSQPVESQFNKLKPSESRYTVLTKDEL